MLDTCSRNRRLTQVMILQLTLLTTFGCGSASKPEGSISGTVKHKGQPVTAGVVNLFDKASGSAATAPLDSTGKFTLSSPLQTGNYNISITPPVPKQLPPGSPPEAPVTFNIPLKYQDPSQSDINKEVKVGANTLDIVIPE